MRGLLLAAASFSAMASAAGAQTTGAALQNAPPPASTVRPDASQSTVQEVVVTAERRNTRLQDTPIAITAVNAEQLQAQGVKDLQGLGSVAPSFNTNQTVGFGTPFLRGVGSTNVTAGDEPSVATYIDGFYQGTSITSQIPFNNIDHVEVLAGPQGTLYGRNAVGGLVNIITRAPKDTFGGQGEVGYGNYNTVDADVYVTGPLVKHVDASLGATYQDQGRGYSLNLLNGDRYGEDNYLALRSKMLIDFGGANSLTIGAAYAHSNDNIANVNLPFPGTTPLLAGPDVLYGTSPHTFAANIGPRFDVEEYSINATLKLDLNFANFVSLSQFRHVRSINQVEGDGTSADGVLETTQLGVAPGGRYGDPLVPLPVIPASFAYFSSEKIPYFTTQELQLLSKPGGPFSWIVGGYFQDDQDGYTPLALSFLQAPEGLLEAIRTHQDVIAFAAYAQGSYTLADGLTFTLGGRYSSEHHHNGGYIIIPSVGNVYDDRNADFDAFTYHAALQYRLDRKLMVFASTSKGFKSGLFDTTDVGGAAVKPETLYDYEVGFKADPTPFVRVDGTFYYYDDHDLQTFVNATSGLTVLENVGGAHMYGGELQLELKPVHALTLTGALGLEHSEYVNTPNASIFAPSPSGGLYTTNADVTGKELVRAPEVTANVSGDYRLEVGSYGAMIFDAAVAYSGDYYWDELNLFQQKAYATLNLSVKFVDAGARWTGTVWGRNVTDTAYAIYRNPQQRFDSTAFAPPATFGVTIGYKF